MLMPNEEVMRLKEELACVRAKCDEINKELCRVLEENHCIQDQLTITEQERDTVLADNSFLRGKVAAYEFMLNPSGMTVCGSPM